MSKEQIRKEPEEKSIVLEITFEGAENVPIVFASNVFVSHTEDVFLITFAQAHPPYIVRPTVEQLRKLGTIPAQVVARIAVPPSKMKEILEVLNGNYQQFVKSQRGEV